jgi:tetratricopeptide (TPR) repeat protein
MSHGSRRTIAVVGVLFLLAAGGLAALYLRGRRDVTTSSEAAYQAYREALQNDRRFYFKEARVGFAQAVALDPDFAEALLGLARRSDHDQAVSLVERARRQRDRLTERERLHVDLQSAAVEEKWDVVMGIARKIREKHPEDIRAAETLARYEIATGHTERAVQIFSELLAIEPNNAEAYNQIGYFFGYRGDYEKAIENLKKYQFMAPDQANPYDSLGEILAYSGRYDEAITNLNRALALKPDFVESRGHLGVVYEGRGEYAKAIESYLRAARESLTDGQRGNFLGKAFRAAMYAGDRAAARIVSEQIRALPKNKEQELRNASIEAALALTDRRFAGAEKTLAELRGKWLTMFQKEFAAVGYKPYIPEGNFLLARAKLALGKEDEAIALYEEMANPPNPWSDFESRRWVYEGRACLAELLARKGDIDRAEQLLAANHKWNPSWAPTHGAELTVARLRQEKVLAASR